MTYDDEMRLKQMFGNEYEKEVANTYFTVQFIFSLLIVLSPFILIGGVVLLMIIGIL